MPASKKLTDCQNQTQVEGLFHQIIETYWLASRDTQFRLSALLDLLHAELAGTFCTSVRTLSHRFKKATGTSIHRYQLSLKLNLAHEQLPLYPNRGLRDIALSFGFYDEFQFSRLFKRQFGYSPSAHKSNN